MIGRRAVCGGALACVAGSAWARQAVLKEAARRAGLHYGTCSDTGLGDKPDYAGLVLAQCDVFAPNLSWKSLATAFGDTLDHFDPNIALVRQGGLALTGYHLLWHLGTPAWWVDLPVAAAERSLREHIAAVAGQFAAGSWSWNVVNEAIQVQDGRPDGLRRSVYLDKFGPAYFKLAFEAAREAAPGVLRVYNDYNLETQDPGQAARRTALLRLLDRFARDGVPVQAVGLQSHLDTRNFAQFSPSAFRAFLREIAGRGLRILLTELDVLDMAAGPVAARDDAVAGTYRRYLETALDEPAVAGVVTWGLSDRYTWLNPSYDKRFARPDGLPTRPLPFDAELRPKPAFQALLDCFRAAPVRTPMRLP